VGGREGGFSIVKRNRAVLTAAPFFASDAFHWIKAFRPTSERRNFLFRDTFKAQLFKNLARTVCDNELAAMPAIVASALRLAMKGNAPDQLAANGAQFFF